MSNITSFLTTCEKLLPIVRAIKQRGGASYLVGGSVRDLVLGRALKDIDIEVHELTLHELEAILKTFGLVMLVGKQFGVFRLHGFDIDWSLPRRDSMGRKPTVEIDPHMSLPQAARRRDITMNAMAIDLDELSNNFNEMRAYPDNIITHVIDPYGGLKDIQAKKLRAVDNVLFLEDPLRFFRVMQFIGRFEMMPDENLTTICQTMELRDVVTGSLLAKERIYEEIKKLFLKSERPSLGLRWLVGLGRLKEIFPELHALIGVPQRQDYHPEGDVFEHTMQALDAAAALDFYKDSQGMSLEDEKFMIMLGVMCHDLGKATMTDKDLHCRGHDIEGVAFAKTLLKRFTDDRRLIECVCSLVHYHMRPFAFIREHAGPHVYKRLAHKLAPEVTMQQLGMVALADIRGRNLQGPKPLTTHGDLYQAFVDEATKAEVLHKPEPPVLLGRHLLAVMKPGPKMGELLKEAYEIQISEGIKDAEVLMQRVLHQNT